VGTGVIVDERGFVVTNEHVARTRQAQRGLRERRGAARHVVSDDAPFTDRGAAHTGRQPKRWPSVIVRPPLGQTVVVSARCSEYRNSVTVGVVSGLNRRYLRADLRGGPDPDGRDQLGTRGLLNTSGQIVGLTTNVVRRIGITTDAYGIAFAISADDAPSSRRSSTRAPRALTWASSTWRLTTLLPRRRTCA
jgi:S1-C subfamily serine protease